MTEKDNIYYIYTYCMIVKTFDILLFFIDEKTRLNNNVDKYILLMKPIHTFLLYE